MSNKLVWSDNSMLNSLLALSEEDLKAELVDYGYDEEFISDMSLDELHNILYEEETLWEMDIEDFENNVVPMINRQTDNGIVLMVGEVARWDGNRKAGKAVFTEDLKGGDIDHDVTSVEIYDDGSGLVWLGHHHDGTHKFRLYALPEENQVEFIEDCMEDAIEDMYNWYYGEDDLGDVRDEIIEDILAQLTDLNFLNENVNFSQVPNYCKPIKNLLNESLNESKDDITTVTVDAVLEDDIDLENIKAFDIEPEYSWNKTFDNLTLTGTKENIVRYLKSGLYNVDDEWIKEYYPELLEEELNEASTKNPKKLGKEIREIKKLAKDYGKEYLTSMPFTSYDNDPTSIEYQYPEFFRIVKLFFKEMGLASPEQLNDNDWLDDMWDVDISQHDWDTIVRVCERLVEKNGNGTIQIEKEYKTGYNSFLNDDEILASREPDDDFIESLNEARYDLLDKKGYPIGSYTDRDKAVKAAKEKENELGSVVIHDKDSVKKYDKKYTGWLKQNESLNEKFEPNSTFYFDNSIDWDEFYDEDFIEKMKEHDGKPCHVAVTVWVDGKEDPASNYFTATFEDGFELEDMSGYHFDLDEVEINESLNEDSGYIVVKGVKVPKEYFDKYPGKTNFEIRDIFLADEEEEDESPYMHADDIEFDEALVEGVKIPKVWLVTDKLDQQFKVRNGNHFYTEEDVKDYYPNVTKVEVVEYFTEDELNEKPWIIDNFNDHKKLKESWDYAIDYANYAWDNPRVDIIKMLKDDGKDKKFIDDVLNLLDEFAAEDELNRLND